MARFFFLSFRLWIPKTVQRSAFCRSRRELSNAYFRAKFGFDTAENEPCQVCPIPRNAAASGSRGTWRRRARRTSAARSNGESGRLDQAVQPERYFTAGVKKSTRRSRSDEKGSFSAVSKPNFASKYAFESSRRDLHNALLCTALQSQFFVKFCRKLR